MITIQTVQEWCPQCEYEVELKAELSDQICPNCNKPLRACSMCITYCCHRCPLDSRETYEEYKQKLQRGDTE